MTKIALILSGGASLGTYTAGAVTELLRALETNRRGDAVQIGVMTGASSGALTAAMAARALVVNPNLLPWIGTAWIRGMDASVLLGSGRNRRSSWLDASVIDEMSRALIASGPAADDEPSSLLGAGLGLGITLSNLYGVPYELSYGFRNRPDRSFDTRLFDDWIEFGLDRDDSAGAPVWEEIRRAAVASASFPFAFPPKLIERQGAEYRGSAVEDAGDLDMWYTDGGLFNNEPVRLAKRLALAAPGGDADWRYIFVDPALRAGSDEQDEARPAAPASAAAVAGLLSRAFLRQGSSKDWIRATRTNERLAILDSLVEQLPEIAESLTEPEAFELGRTVGELAEQVCERRLECGGRERWTGSGAAPGPDPVMDLLEQSLARIERRHARVLAQVASRAARSRLVKLIFLLEAAGGLDDKENLPLYLVAPSGPLAGDFLGGFGGMFCEEWREADFRAGRQNARHLLETALADLVRYEPDADDAYEVPDVDPSIDALPASQRRRLEGLIEAEAGRAIGEIDAGFVGNLFGFAWRPVLRRLASQRVLEALRGAPS